MGIIISCDAGTDFSANGGAFLPPVITGLTDWYVMGDTSNAGNSAGSARNLAPGGVSAVVSGAPTVATNHLQSNQANLDRFITATIPASDCTIFAAVTDGGTTAQGVIVPCFGVGTSSGSAKGWDMWLDNTDVSGSVTIDDWTDTLTATAPGNGIGFSGLPLSFGPSAVDEPDNIASGTARVAFGASHSRVLAQTECTTLVPVIRHVLARRGITVRSLSEQRIFDRRLHKS